jgi:hypothetical protein
VHVIVAGAPKRDLRRSLIEMKLTTNIVIPLFISIAFAMLLSCKSIVCPEPNARKLPLGGTFYQHPRHPGVQYYFLPEPRYRGDLCQAKHVTLFKTNNGGKHWIPATSYAMKRLYMNPVTGDLFGILNYKVITSLADEESNEASSIVWASVDRPIVSSDGENWRDLMHGSREDSVTVFLDFFQDPQQPQRTCVLASRAKLYILIASDDRHTSWTWFRHWEWPSWTNMTEDQLHEVRSVLQKYDGANKPSEAIQ